jgi:glycine/D-amino acid oxidase-like deaminating enzyme
MGDEEWRMRKKLVVKTFNFVLSGDFTPHSSYLYTVKADYLIVGQGIAGSVLALTLHNAGKRVVIINKEGLSSSSAVAAGIYNPFNFRKGIPTRYAKEASPFANRFYTNAEQMLGAAFHSQRNIIRVFGNAEEQSRWNEYLTGTEPKFATAENADESVSKNLHAPFGTGVVSGGGVLNTGQFIYEVKNYFSDRNLYREEKFTGNLEFSEEEVLYNGQIAAQRIIFCEGHLATENKYYPRLSIAPTKGETLHVSIPGLNCNEVINGPVYLSPLGNDLYDCGATFNPGKSDEEISQDGREELIRKLQSMIRIAFRPESHFAGVRPAGRDRKPVIGVSREQHNVAFFNGFGSKAVLLAPFLAQMLADHLENGAEILPEVNISRFKVH